MFVDPDRPHDDYLLTYNCLACPDNARTYNVRWRARRLARPPAAAPRWQGAAQRSALTLTPSVSNTRHQTMPPPW